MSLSNDMKEQLARYKGKVYLLAKETINTVTVLKQAHEQKNKGSCSSNVINS